MSLITGAGAFPFEAYSQEQPTPAPIRDIVPPIDVFPYPTWMIVAITTGIVLILALIIGLIVRWIRRRPLPPPPSPRELAITKLNKARREIENKRPYEFSILVSDILRSYMADQFHVQAKEQTSPEFLASIANFSQLTEQEKTLLSLFLEKSDLIKFARLNATTEDSAMLVEQAIRFVEGVVP